MLEYCGMHAAKAVNSLSASDLESLLVVVQNFTSSGDDLDESCDDLVYLFNAWTRKQTVHELREPLAESELESEERLTTEQQVEEALQTLLVMSA